LQAVEVVKFILLKKGGQINFYSNHCNQIKTL